MKKTSSNLTGETARRDSGLIRPRPGNQVFQVLLVPARRAEGIPAENPARKVR